MRLTLVPHTADLSSARIWMCASETAAAPAQFVLTVHKVGDIAVGTGAWQAVTVDGILAVQETKTWVQTVQVSGLSPGTRYVCSALGEQAEFATLPAQLPTRGSEPFNLLLGSCYFSHRDQGVEQAFRTLAAHERPHAKILCGDQVYLDVSRALIMEPAPTQAAVARLHLGKYLKNWTASGLKALLGVGSTWFTSDDHEFWNNSPDPATAIVLSWLPPGRNWMLRSGLNLFQTFQAASAGASQKFQAGRLSVYVADTRVFRKGQRRACLRPDNLRDLLDWIGTLRGPGVLVVGQPVLDEPQSWFGGTFADWSLPNYPEYGPIAQALAKAAHSILVLTGDVHYPRVARVNRHDGRLQLLEVISSPLALVSGQHGTPKPPPGKFQMMPVTQEAPRRSADNFALLQFTETSGRVSVRVRHYMIPGGWTAGQEFDLD
jgi:hypothetical protein